ncbi:hypothetical protein GCM10011487_16440 [Steroidobacter agaridevorans]|uniref:PDZ domain-containing protein n=2 Tax=Steroidobacter agaridevorans TaxID=2695856 RepID=A0A829Y8L5_9GAMM|nr:hypothetical protein GCM10011487_16440 [Steroidobacter agaridevorans]
MIMPGMNRYQREVAEMDRRHRWLMRTFCVAASSVVVAVFLWAADISPKRWFGDSSETAQSAAVAPAPTASVQPANTNQQSAPDASDPQRLILVSTSPGRTPYEGTARLGPDPAEPQTYVAGAVLANGAELVEIHADRVLLKRGTETATLYVAGGGAGAAAALTSLRAADVPAPSAKRAAYSITNIIRSAPHYENGLMDGLEIFPGKDRGAFAQLGLQSGDVIFAIDGAVANDVLRAREQLSVLAKGEVVTVTIRRGDVVTDLALDGSVIANDRAATPGSPLSAS